MTETRSTTPPRTFLVLCAVLGAASGCSGLHETSRTGAVHYVQIRDHISPQTLYVHVGDEVRWQNLREGPVNVGILEHKKLDQVSCQKGFISFGEIQDLVTIEPEQYASLCFAQTGTVHYNVWMEPDDPKGTMSPTATIRVSEAAP